WNQFELGLAPILIGFFFISSVQLFFVGIVGEYIGSIWTQVRHHPLVFEKERLNFYRGARSGFARARTTVAALAVAGSDARPGPWHASHPAARRAGDVVPRRDAAVGRRAGLLLRSG